MHNGLVKQVNLQRAPTRYCPNLQEHSHFFCERCGSVFDVEAPVASSWRLGTGFVVSHAEVTFKGVCPDCSNNYEFNRH